MSPTSPRETNNEPKAQEQPAQTGVPTEGIQVLSLESANSGAPAQQAMEWEDEAGKGNDCTPPAKSPLLAGSIHSVHADPVRVALEACKELEERRRIAGNAFTLATAKSSTVTASERKELLKEFKDIEEELRDAKAVWHSMYPIRLEFFRKKILKESIRKSSIRS